MLLLVYPSFMSTKHLKNIAFERYFSNVSVKITESPCNPIWTTRTFQLIKVLEAGLEPAQPSLAKGF